MAVSVTPPGPTQDRRPIRRALISVFDKTGLEDLARGLHEAGVDETKVEEEVRRRYSLPPKRPLPNQTEDS